MLSRLRPQLFLDSVQAIDLRLLRRQGIRGIIVDLDNTLAGWQAPRPTAEVLRWLRRMRSGGVQAVILSNNRVARVERFAAECGVPFISNAGKPRMRNFRRAMELIGTTVRDTAVVGDQMFTDILGGNRMGLFTILVAPVNRHEFVGTRAVRKVESAVLRHFRRSGLRVPANFD